MDWLKFRNLDQIFDARHPRRTPGDAQGFRALGPRAHLATQNDCTALRLDHDVLRVERGAAYEGLLDPRLDIVGRHARPDDDQVGHTSHTEQLADHFFGILALIVAIDCAFECDPALAHHHFDPIEDQLRALLQHLYGGAGNVRISPLARTRQTNLN